MAILVAATATAGTLLHTASAGAVTIDYVTMEAVNTSAATVALTIEYGGVTSPDDHIVIDLAPKVGRQVVLDRVPINGGLAIRAFAGTANVITIGGEILRVTL